eukprot:GHVQ01020755.1.p1 GENE.GHVQ01020755.1~~GHVQ01020755.1.p1  ORF type:complete len:511 (+),score=82.28 GHVQ01020755.1:75-1607(+)
MSKVSSRNAIRRDPLHVDIAREDVAALRPEQASAKSLKIQYKTSKYKGPKVCGEDEGRSGVRDFGVGDEVSGEEDDGECLFFGGEGSIRKREGMSVGTKKKRVKVQPGDASSEGLLDAKMSRRVLEAVDLQQKEFREEEVDEMGSCSTPADGPEQEEGDLAVDEDGFVCGEDELADILKELGEGGKYNADTIVRRCRTELSRGEGEDEHEGRGSGRVRGLEGLRQRGGGSDGGGMNLSDVVMDKLKEFEETKQRSNEQNGMQVDRSSTTAVGGMSEKVVSVYRSIGEYLKRYRSGKLPKAFKVLPMVRNWEEILMLTDPIGWSPQAMVEATKIFSSNFNAKMAQRFYNLVLLPAVREDIAANKRLNYHYYEALKKAMFKPAAWFKGILLPLVLDGCTLREVVIVGSILHKISVPVLHAGAALIRMCDIEPWEHNTAYLINVLINKKFSLPTQVVSRVAGHFCAFQDICEVPLPVVWHKCLLSVVQRYKGTWRCFVHLRTCLGLLHVQLRA